MSLEKDFLTMTSATVTIEPLSTAIDSYGAPQWSSSDAASYDARVEPGTRVVLTPEGVEEIATATLFVLSSSASVGPQDRVTFPDGRQPKLLTVEPLSDEQGQHHIEIAMR